MLATGDVVVALNSLAVVVSWKLSSIDTLFRLIEKITGFYSLTQLYDDLKHNDSKTFYKLKRFLWVFKEYTALVYI